MISYVLPTRDRPEIIARTLAALGHLGRPADAIAHAGDEPSEVIVIDNASTMSITRQFGVTSITCIGSNHDNATS